MFYYFFIPFIAAFLTAIVIVPVFQKFGLEIGAYVAQRRSRDVHDGIVSRFGGLAIFITFFASFLIFVPFVDSLLSILIIGALVIIVFVWDDIFGVRWQWKLFWQIIIALAVASLGIGVSKITGPFGYVLELDTIKFHLFNLFGRDFSLVLWRDLFTLIWIPLIMNSMNFLDGLDGLATGVSSIGFFILFLASFGQNPIGLICVILLGALLGLLPYNFNPARIFLGDSGAYFLGFMLAVLSIISEGKLAIMTMVLGVPILDGIWVILNRLINKKSPFSAGREHLHHRLLDLGFTQRQIVLIVYIICAAFGFLSLVLEQGRFLAFLTLFLLMLTLTDVLAFIPWKNKDSS